MLTIKIVYLTLAVVVLSHAQAQAYTDEELAMAIYHAEGGAATKYPFGIRSVPCATYSDCKIICKATIRHNRSRFAHIRNKGHQSYLEYLAGRYCPSQGGALTSSERKLNRYWLNNVTAALRKYDHDRT